MKATFNEPLDQIVLNTWNSIGRSYKAAFLVILLANLLAFGFEMTNLTLHHDDLVQIFIQDTILGHYLGRIGTGWLHYYTQDGHIMPFLQMAQAIVLMTTYGVLTAHLWGARKTMDIALIGSILCLFPYMAQVYQYNANMVPYSAAHLLSALAVFLSVRGTVRHVALAAIAYAVAFSMYQTVIANAATIFGFWVLATVLFKADVDGLFSKPIARSMIAALIAVGAGGLIYLGALSQMNIEFGAYQGANEAFSLKDGLQFSLAATEILKGTRSFFFWPEHYFPDYLKKIQLVVLCGAAALCLWLSKGATNKVGALSVFVFSFFAPRLLQLLHPQGHYHSLTLTAYAVVIAGSLMIILRAGYTPMRNLSALLAFVLVGGYLIQCNWISTVGHLNTLAHYSTMTQIMTRIKSLPAEGWDGKTVAVVGRRRMFSGYPFKRATGVATAFIDASHMQNFARLLRDDMVFVKFDDATPGTQQYAAKQAPWPNPASVGVADGVAVVVLSKVGSITKPQSIE